MDFIRPLRSRQCLRGINLQPRLLVFGFLTAALFGGTGRARRRGSYPALRIWVTKKHKKQGRNTCPSLLILCSTACTSLRSSTNTHAKITIDRLSTDGTLSRSRRDGIETASLRSPREAGAVSLEFPLGSGECLQVPEQGEHRRVISPSESNVTISRTLHHGEGRRAAYLGYLG